METSSDHPKILIIEDDPDQLELIHEALCMHYGDPEGESIVGVRTATECLSMDLDEFDVALLDYHLPDMSGIELLRKLVRVFDLPVIIITGENDPNTAFRAIRAGAEDYLVKLGDYLFALPVLVDKSVRQHRVRKENERLQRKLRVTLGRLRLRNVQLQESMKKLEAMARTDGLTGLSNRRRFTELLERYFGEARRYGFDLTCCMCDLDHFKGLNDMCGHQVGDKVLILTAKIIRRSLRSTDIAARYGGDEFVLLLPHTSARRAREIAARIRRELVVSTQQYDEVPAPVTLSVGIASLAGDDPREGDELLTMADTALYMAKNKGKDLVMQFTETSAPEGAMVRGEQAPDSSDEQP